MAQFFWTQLPLSAATGTSLERRLHPSISRRQCVCEEWWSLLAIRSAGSEKASGRVLCWPRRNHVKHEIHSTACHRSFDHARVSLLLLKEAWARYGSGRHKNGRHDPFSVRRVYVACSHKRPIGGTS